MWKKFYQKIIISQMKSQKPYLKGQGLKGEVKMNILPCKVTR